MPVSGPSPPARTAATVTGLSAVGLSHVGVSLVSDPGVLVAVAWVERSDESFTLHLTGPVSQGTTFSFTLIEPI